MMIWYMMVWYMMMIRKYPWWREMHGHCTTRWVETKRFLKRCSAVCWSSDVKSQSDKFGFCRPLFREAPVHSWFHHHPLCWMSSLSLYTFLVFLCFPPIFYAHCRPCYLPHPGQPRAAQVRRQIGNWAFRSTVAMKPWSIAVATSSAVAPPRCLAGVRQCWENDEKKRRSRNLRWRFS